MRSAAVYGIAKILGSAAGFARNLLLARLLGLEDFGVAAIFSIVVGLIELASDLGLQKMLIQSQRSNIDALKSTLQALNIIKNILVAIIILLAAPAGASFFNAEEAVDAIRVLALYPIISGFYSFEVAHQQRVYNFKGLIVVELCSHGVALAATLPLIEFFGNYWAALVCSLIYKSVGVIASHAVSRANYTLMLDWKLTKLAVQFGLPLLVNGLVLGVIMQSEKAIIGNLFSVQSLAIFTVAFALTSLSASILQSLIGTFCIPFIASATDMQRNERLETVAQITLLMATTYFIFMSESSSALVSVVYGEDYRAAGQYIAALAILQAIRLVKIGFSISAIGLGHTGVTLKINMPRLFTVPVTYYVATKTGDIEAIILCSAIGEFASMLLAIYLLYGNCRFGLLEFLLQIIISTIIALAVTKLEVSPQTADPLLALVSASLSTVVCGLIICAMLPRGRKLMVCAIKRFI
jgi:O-antigen/teichoic acid export membrane protein